MSQERSPSSPTPAVASPPNSNVFSTMLPITLAVFIGCLLAASPGLVYLASLLLIATPATSVWVGIAIYGACALGADSLASISASKTLAVGGLPWLLLE